MHYTIHTSNLTFLSNHPQMYWPGLMLLKFGDHTEPEFQHAIGINLKSTKDWWVLKEIEENSSVQTSKKATKYNIHLKKIKGYNDWNIVRTTSRTSILVWIEKHNVDICASPTHTQNHQHTASFSIKWIYPREGSAHLSLSWYGPSYKLFVLHLELWLLFL